MYSMLSHDHLTHTIYTNVGVTMHVSMTKRLYILIKLDVYRIYLSINNCLHIINSSILDDDMNPNHFSFPYRVESSQPFTRLGY